MTTKFTGVRINKNKIPMVVEIINLNSIIDNISDDGSIGGGSKIDMDTNNNLSNSLFATLDTEDSIVLAPESNYDYDSFISKYPDVKFDFITTNPNGATGAFNESNPHLRRLLYSLGKRLDKRMESFTITSMARTNATYKDISGSDHAVGAKVNKHRKKIKGKDINDNEQTYDNMGCAVDIIGLNASGSKDKRNTSIALFDLLALEYTNNIRQLLWEVKEGFSTSDNCISNCIHLSTYGGSGKTEDGKGSLNDKHEIGVQIYDKSSKKWTYLTANNRKDKSKAPTNLPPMFIKTLHRLYLANKADKLYVPNFNYALTGEMLEKWCNELNV
jgi:hypothetical protein